MSLVETSASFVVSSSQSVANGDLLQFLVTSSVLALLDFTFLVLDPVTDFEGISSSSRPGGRRYVSPILSGFGLSLDGWCGSQVSHGSWTFGFSGLVSVCGCTSGSGSSSIGSSFNSNPTPSPPPKLPSSYSCLATNSS